MCQKKPTNTHKCYMTSESAKTRLEKRLQQIIDEGEWGPTPLKVLIELLAPEFTHAVASGMTQSQFFQLVKKYCRTSQRSIQRHWPENLRRKQGMTASRHPDQSAKSTLPEDRDKPFFKPTTFSTNANESRSMAEILQNTQQKINKQKNENKHNSSN